MQKIRLTKINGYKSSDSALNKEHCVEGNIVGGLFPKKPTIGRPFVIDSYRTSLVEEILSENTFRTYNSTYRWEIIA